MKQAGSKKLYTRHGKATDALAAIKQNTKRVDDIADKARFEQAGVEIIIFNYSAVKAKAGIGVNMHKLLTYGISQFTSRYNGKEPAGCAYEVSFSIDDYIRITGGMIPQDRKKRRRKRNEMQKRVSGELMLLQSIQLTDISGNDFESISPICRTAARNGNITIEFSRPFAAYLLKLPMMPIHKKLLAISARCPTAYAIGWKFAEHHNINQRRHTQAGNKLKVRNLLKVSPLPDYESVLKDNKGWNERIKQPFEKAMNELMAAGVLKAWNYENLPAGANYHTFKDAMIVFKLAADE